jgi:hexosaminidase
MNTRFSLISLLYIMLVSVGITKAAGPQKDISLIPQPVKLERQVGSFQLSKSTKLISTAANKEIATLFAAMLKAPTGYTLPHTTSGNAGIQLLLNKSSDPQLGTEGYALDILPTKITIRANKAAGLFYGMQTLMQLLPKEIESSVLMKNTSWSIPCVKIIDYPRFGWRGLMLDVSRHYFPKEMVKKYINQLAKYKMNVFHWHLTDDQGWRIEIKSLPKLTEVGAWRAPRDGLWWTRPPQADDEAATYGGFYTQEDVKEIVEYAQKRFVTILPEIDVPGHSLAALAAYPELSCTGKNYKVNVGNLFYGIDDNALCPGNDQTYDFMRKVIDEVANLFPGQFIHIGGDECFKGFWKDCSKCQKRMSDEKLKSVDELQSYFIRRMEGMLKAKGKKLMGWDEILEGGLAPDANVMSWRGMGGGVAAAKMNRQVVMTPTSHCYLDLYQGDPAVEPPTYSMLTLASCYNFDPVPAEITDKSLILGGQGNLWTESVPTYRQVEYMTWPRAFALSEVFWSQRNRMSWESFIPRMEGHFERYDMAQVNYARSAYDAVITPVKDTLNKKVRIRLDTEIKKLDIYYTFDNTYPDRYSPKYKDTLSVPIGADHLRVLTYRNNSPVGKMITIPIRDLEKRAGIKGSE